MTDLDLAFYKLRTFDEGPHPQGAVKLYASEAHALLREIERLKRKVVAAAKAKKREKWVTP